MRDRAIDRDLARFDVVDDEQLRAAISLEVLEHEVFDALDDMPEGRHSALMEALCNGDTAEHNSTIVLIMRSAFNAVVDREIAEFKARLREPAEDA
ncbi:hypothetical protein AWB76_03259 [Caballeronia temeraria]|uniref:Uncharacterized protein n=2 Tax=Caballeronia temeraria TaxID=1777137 RepID=A0A158AXH2_9BURK|nr:hypothetical protein AWB76_03259 [Caballeronia temeraria]